MSALEEPINPRIDQTWSLPKDLRSFLLVLRRTPSMGTTDRARLAKFLTFQQSEWMPKRLRSEIDTYMRAAR